MTTRQAISRPGANRSMRESVAHQIARRWLMPSIQHPVRTGPSGTTRRHSGDHWPVRWISETTSHTPRGGAAISADAARGRAAASAAVPPVSSARWRRAGGGCRAGPAPAGWRGRCGTTGQSRRNRLGASLIVIQIMMERCRAGNAVPASSHSCGAEPGRVSGATATAVTVVRVAPAG